MKLKAVETEVTNLLINKSKLKEELSLMDQKIAKQEVEFKHDLDCLQQKMD
jgi:hypothetical protein